MKLFRAVALLAFVVAGCGDNYIPEGTSSPSGFSSVGGSQVAHSKSFMLVTRVGTSPQATSTSRTHTLESGLGE